MKVQSGDRVKMIGIMPEDPAPMEVGAEGTVKKVLNEGTQYEQIDVAWDSGRHLFLLPTDPFEVIKEPEACVWGAYGSMVNACDQDATEMRDGFGYCAHHARLIDVFADMDKMDAEYPPPPEEEQ